MSFTSNDLKWIDQCGLNSNFRHNTKLLYKRAWWCNNDKYPIGVFTTNQNHSSFNSFLSHSFGSKRALNYMLTCR